MMAEPKRGLSVDEAKALCDRVLSYSKADHARVNLNSGWRGYSRVATNRITSAGGSNDTSVRVTSVFGKRVASVSTNALDHDSLAAAVAKSESLARIAPEDPEYLPELGPESYLKVKGYYETTGAMATEERAQACAKAIDAAKRSGTVAAAYMDVRAGSDAVATSNGLFAYHEDTGVAYTLTARTPDGSSSGWAGDEAADWRNIESDRIAADAVRKCLAWRGKTDLDPGEYTAILEPTAMGMLMLRMRSAFDGRTADEGRSYFSKSGGGNRIGEKLFDERVTIQSNPLHPDGETAPFTGDGLPVTAKTWVEDGVLKQLEYSRWWAEKQGVQPVPPPQNFVMSGGDATVDDLIASTERGVLITRFWYIRGLNPRTISYTGLTRDGTFLIENGKISRPVTNFRFNQSLVELLQNIEAMGKPVRVAATENSSVGPPIIVPPVKVNKFTLSSVSDAI